MIQILTTRWWNIGFRTVHIAAMGVLLGGHAFDVPKSELTTSLVLAVVSGILLTFSEAGPHLLWFHQIRGLVTIAKLVLLCAVPLCWSYSLPIMLSVVVMASVASHMPARLRYYSVLRGEVIRDCCGPGVSRLDGDS